MSSMVLMLLDKSSSIWMISNLTFSLVSKMQHHKIKQWIISLSGLFEEEARFDHADKKDIHLRNVH